MYYTLFPLKDSLYSNQLFLPIDKCNGYKNLKSINCTGICSIGQQCCHNCLQDNTTNCKKCNKIIFKKFDFCLRCRPKCKLCLNLTVKIDDIYSDFCSKHQ